MSTEILSSEHQELLVYGYIRNHQYLLLNLIPIAIINLFATWYKSNSDEWMTEESSFELYIKDKILINEINSSQWLNAFGTQIIGKGEKKIWKLRINGNTNPKPIISARIGIIDTSQLEQNKDIQSLSFMKLIMKRNSSRKHGSFDQDFVGSSAISGVSGNFWWWINSQKRINKQYAQPFKNNDIITMELDLMETFTLKFKVNDQHFGIAQQHIDSNKKYKLAVAVIREESVTILQ
eukprot:161611_1